MYIQRNVKACWEFYIMHSPQTVIPFNPFCGGGGAYSFISLQLCVYLLQSVTITRAYYVYI